MKKLLVGGVALLASAAAIAQVVPATTAPASAPAAKVHTRAEVQTKISEHFAKPDTNRDGSLTKAEADAAREAFRSQRAEKRDGRRENAFARIDANRDGSISRAEWDAAGAQREQRLASRDQAARAGKRGGTHRLARFDGRMFETADANRDGQVTLPEAQAAALRHFDMADANRDGQITPDERRQMRQRMRTEHRG